MFSVASIKAALRQLIAPPAGHSSAREIVDLRMTQQVADHRQIFAELECVGSAGMPKVVDTYII